MAMASILFIGKRDDFFCDRAVEFMRLHFPETTFVLARRGEPRPQIFDTWQGDYILSYLSPFIVPGSLLARAKQAAINFHPGPPEYPGTGCTNFALYHEVKDYGVTCHHMLEKVDTGAVVGVRRFPVLPADTVYAVTQRCYAALLDLFYEVMGGLAAGHPLPVLSDKWTRKPFTRSELDALCEITPDMPEDEMSRRVRAVTFPNAPGAFVDLYGHRFVYSGPVPPRKEGLRP